MTKSQNLDLADFSFPQIYSTSLTKKNIFSTKSRLDKDSTQSRAKILTKSKFEKKIQRQTINIY